MNLECQPQSDHCRNQEMRTSENLAGLASIFGKVDGRTARNLSCGLPASYLNVQVHPRTFYVGKELLLNSLSH